MTDSSPLSSSGLSACSCCGWQTRDLLPTAFQVGIWRSAYGEGECVIVGRGLSPRAQDGPRTTSAAEGWHNSHFGTPHPSLRVFLHWLQKCQFEVQSRCIQLAAGKPPKQQLVNYVNVNKDLWDAKVRYGMDIGYIFALPAIDMPAVYYSRLLFRTHYNSHLSA